MRIDTPDSISIGPNCNMARDAYITGGGVLIGNWVGFRPDVKVWSINHKFDDSDRPWLQRGHDFKPAVIENDARRAIVSACTVVSKSVSPYSIFTGNPGKVIRW